MAKRNLLKAAGIALAATGALGLGLGTLPWRPTDRVWGKLTMSPKQYGIWLLMTGKKQV